MKVYLNETIHPEAEALLRSRVEVVNTFDQIEEIDGILSRGTAVTEEMMAKAKKLKVVGKHGVGLNKLDLDAAKKYGIRVVNTPTANRDSVAELVVCMALNCARNVLYAGEEIRQNHITRIADPRFTGFELAGKTFAAIGMGNIAQRVAKILRDGFGMKIIGYDPYTGRQNQSF